MTIEQVIVFDARLHHLTQSAGIEGDVAVAADQEGILLDAVNKIPVHIIPMVGVKEH